MIILSCKALIFVNANTGFVVLMTNDNSSQPSPNVDRVMLFFRSS
jgi:hypothetical protein